MYGIYPYSEVTERQLQAMKISDVPYKALSIYDIAYKCIIRLLN